MSNTRNLVLDESIYNENSNELDPEIDYTSDLGIYSYMSDYTRMDRNVHTNLMNLRMMKQKYNCVHII